MRNLIQKIKNKVAAKATLMLVGATSILATLLSLPREVSAQVIPAALTLSNLIGGNSLYEVLIKLLTQIGNLVLSVTAIYVKICAAILNMAINLTMNISWFVNNNPAIDTTWITIRDFSSIFFIAMLIYSSICLIIGIGGPGVKKTIINVVTAALLVNFSLFFTKVLIDVSNVATLSIYSSIAPGEVVRLSKDSSLSRQQSLLSDNGMSNVFMGLLKLQTIYDPSGSIGPNAAVTGINRGSVAFRIIVATFMGAVIMIIAGTNFAVISLIFLSRFAILILLLIFSPIAFLGNIVPMLSEHSSRWRKELYDQLLFPPLYFIIVYVALKIMTEPRFQNLMGGSTKTGTFASAFLDAGSAGIGVIIQYGIVIYLMIQALVIAKKSSGSASEFTDKYIKKYGGMVTGAVLSNTIGLGATALRGTDGYKRFLSKTPNSVGMFVDSKMKDATKAKFGSDKSYTDRVDAYKKKNLEYSKSLALGPDAKAAAMKKYNEDVKAIEDSLKSAEKKLANIDSNPAVVEKKKAVEDANALVQQLKNERLAEEMDGRYDPTLDARTRAAEKTKADAVAALKEVSENTHKEASKNVEEIKAKLSKLDNPDARKKHETEAGKELQRKLVGELNNNILFRRQGKAAAKAVSDDIGKDQAQQNLDTIKKLLEDAGKAKS